MRAFHRAGAIAAVALVTGLSGVLVAASVITASAQTAGKTMTTSSGLQITDSVIVTGATPKTGQTCVMHYTGWLYENGVKARSSTVRSTAASHSSFRSAQAGSFVAGMKAWRR